MNVFQEFTGNRIADEILFSKIEDTSDQLNSKFPEFIWNVEISEHSVACITMTSKERPQQVGQISIARTGLTFPL